MRFFIIYLVLIAVIVVVIYFRHKRSILEFNNIKIGDTIYMLSTELSESSGKDVYIVAKITSIAIRDNIKYIEATVQNDIKEEVYEFDIRSLESRDIIVANKNK